MAMDSYYVLSLNILKALGGDVSITYPDADSIWVEINKIYNNAGNRFDIAPLEKIITENGEYNYYPDDNIDAFTPVNINVNVPQKYTDEQVHELEQLAESEGYKRGYDEGEEYGKLTGREEGYTEGFNSGVDAGQLVQKNKLTSITIAENGVYEKEDGWNNVTVEVAGGVTDEEVETLVNAARKEGYRDGYSFGVDEGITYQKNKLGTTTFDANGNYTCEDGWNNVTVEVDIPEFETEQLNVELKENKNYTYTPTTDGFSSVNISVNVPSSGGGDTGKPKIYNGFRLLENNATFSNNDAVTNRLAEVDFSLYDWSNVYNLEEFFGGFTSNTGFAWKDSDFDNFREHFNGTIVSCKNMFKPKSGATSYAPLAQIPDFSKFTNNLISLSNVFNGCNSLVDASNISKWNTSNVIDMQYMFYNCNKLTSVPYFDTSNVIDMQYMYSGCKYLTSCPELNTSKVLTINAMFYDCNALTTVPIFDMSNVGNTSNMFYNCKKLTTIGGLTNLGKPIIMTTNNMFYNCNALTYDSIMNIINGLYDRAAAGYPLSASLPLGSTNLAKLSDEEKAIATNKGWTLS